MLAMPLSLEIFTGVWNRVEGRGLISSSSLASLGPMCRWHGGASTGHGHCPEAREIGKGHSYGVPFPNGLSSFLCPRCSQGGFTMGFVGTLAYP